MAAVTPPKTDRNQDVYQDVVAKDGPRMSYRQAARRHGISSTRIQQIVAREKRKRGET